MSIKNFTVISKRIKEKSDGLIKYINYLEEKNTASHKNTTIINLLGENQSRKFLESTILEVFNFDRENTKGGRKVESFAQSFNLVLPETVAKPTPEQWKLITKDVLEMARGRLGIQDDVKTFAKKCFFNIHDQSNPHLNLVIPRIYNGERLKNLDQKALIGAMKKEFNASVMKHCQIDFKQYKPFNQNVGPRREKWQMEQKKAIEAQEKAAAMQQEATETALRAAQEHLEASQMVEVATKAQQAAEQAKAEADRSVKAMSQMTQLFTQFKGHVITWVRSILEKDFIAEQSAELDVVNTVEKIQHNPIYSDNDEELLITTLEVAEMQVEPYTQEREKPLLTNKVQRKRRSKPGW